MVKNNISKDSVVKFDDGIVHKYKLNKNEGYIYFGNSINSLIVNNVLYIKEGESSNIDATYDYNVSENVSENKIIHFTNCDTIYVSFSNEVESDAYIYYVDYNKNKESLNLYDRILLYPNFINKNIKVSR